MLCTRTCFFSFFDTAEVVQERVGEGKGQRLSTAVHVIDALFLGGADLRGEGYSERMEKAELMTRTIVKLTNRDLTPVRTKRVYELKRMEEVVTQRLKLKQVKGDGMETVYFSCAWELMSFVAVIEYC